MSQWIIYLISKLFIYTNYAHELFQYSEYDFLALYKLLLLFFFF